MNPPRNPKTGTSKVEKVLAGWSTGQRSLLTLADMITFANGEFITELVFLECANTMYLEQIKNKSGNKSLPKPERAELLSHVLGITAGCVELQIESAVSRATDLGNRLNKSSGHTDCSVRSISQELSPLIRDITCHLRWLHFLHIPKEDTTFLNQESWFGDSVHNSFVNARRDIKESGNCIALDLNTAAVFHLMRVMEVGVKVMARHLNVKGKASLDYVTIGKMAGKIEAKLKTRTLKRTGKKRTEALEFYNGLLGEINALTNVWRNPVMHSRAYYNKNDALGVAHHVKEFMKRLATRVSE